MAHMTRGMPLFALVGAALCASLLVAAVNSAPNPRLRDAVLESLRTVGISPNEAVMLGGVYYLIEAIEVGFSAGGDPIITVRTKRPPRQ